MTAPDPDLGRELTKELSATLHARKELGPEYEPEPIDSFLDKVGRRLDSQTERRVRREVAEQQVAEAPAGNHGHSYHGAGRRGSRLAALSLALAIPLSAIGGRTAHLPGLLATWAGIVGVNLAHSLGLIARGRRHSRDDRRGSQDSPWE